MKIIDYKVITCSKLSTLQEAVKTAMDIGWQPIGGMVTMGHYTDYFQTMVKYADVKYLNDRYQGPG